MTIFDRTWDATYEADPADSSNISLGALQIRDLKIDIRERVAVDHSFVGDVNDGKHLRATLLLSTIKPTLDATDGAVYAKAVGGVTQLFYEDSAGIEVQLTSGAGNVGGQNIYMKTDALGNTILNFYANTYLIFDPVAVSVALIVNGVLKQTWV